MRQKHIKLPDSLLPREYQYEAKEAAIDLMESKPEQWHLFSSPTGTGKSVCELLTLAELQAKGEIPILVTPRVEIISGMMEKMGHYVEDMTNDKIVGTATQYGLYTPIRLRNLLAKGEMPHFPTYVLIDECHHDLADTYQDITMYLNGVPKCGFTATPFRGTPKGTNAFLEQWGNTVNEILSLPDAVEQGYCKLPAPSIWPLVDDDIIQLSNGEIKATAADAVITDKIDALIDRIKPLYCKKSKLYDMPTMIALPTTNLCNALVNKMNAAGLPAVKVTQDTKRKDRQTAFRQTVSGEKILVQIDVVSEGVDLPIRRLIDIRPTMSPVKWLQQIGRIMRPTADTPEYICCCRNLERHGYLMGGLLPNSTIKEAQEAFKTPSTRSGMRAVGLEGLGKFISTPVQLMNGLTVFTYSLVSMDEYQRTEYFVMVHPNQLEPVCGVKVSARDGSEIKWGKWALTESIPEVKGFQSAKPYPLTDPQRNKWNQLAEQKGLNVHQNVTNRNIQTLFFLLNTGLKLS